MEIEELEQYLLSCPLFNDSKRSIEESFLLLRGNHRLEKLQFLAELVGGCLEQLLDDIEKEP